MPSPRRVARQTVSVLVGMGMTKPEAAKLVTIICDEVTGIIWRQSPEMDITWLADIASEAMAIQAQARDLGGAVQTYSERVAHWARRFDQLKADRAELGPLADRRPDA